MNITKTYYFIKKKINLFFARNFTCGFYIKKNDQLNAKIIFDKRNGSNNNIIEDDSRTAISPFWRADHEKLNK